MTAEYTALALELTIPPVPKLIMIMLSDDVTDSTGLCSVPLQSLIKSIGITEEHLVWEMYALENYGFITPYHLSDQPEDWNGNQPATFRLNKSQVLKWIETYP